MHIAYLLIGGNIGNRLEYLKQARQILDHKGGRLLKSSSIYETAAWGKTDQESFLNQVLELETPFEAYELMSLLLTIEEKMGRTRQEKFGPRTIDIDILLFDDEVHNDAHVTIPHPQLPARRFALAPLAELAAKKVHPVIHKTIEQLLQECTDPLPVKRINE